VLELAKNTTVDAQTHTHTQREGDIDLRGSTRCLRPLGRRERSIDDLYKIQEDYTWFSQELSPEKSTHHKTGYILYL